VITRKPLELPPAVARAFVEDMKAFFAEENRYKQDEIAARQLHILKQYQGPREKKLRLSDVKAMFYEMRDQAR
jgi:lipase chaperone LimK